MMNDPQATGFPLEAVTRRGVRWDAGEVVPVEETIAAEVPVALIYNGISHVVMLATPLDLEDFGRGFSLSEGIVHQPREVHDVEAMAVAQGIEVHLTIATERFVELKERRRNLAGRTGCGLCGTESLSQAIRDVPRVGDGPRVDPAALHRAFEGLAKHQKLHDATGAVHAAAWATPQGEVLVAREDIGRHNALDKLIGAMAREERDFGDGITVITSRASSEMVQKATTVGMRVLAAISAPTALAARLADEANLTLAGFARKGRHVVYAHPERFT